MLQPHELLDRYEILFPTNSKVSDLRRAYIDKDLSSIFRVVNDKNKDDLRKFIMEDNLWKLWPLLDRIVDTQFTAAFKNFFVNETEFDKDCFSRGQLESKLWAVRELKKVANDLGTVFLCAGWYGTLATLLFESKMNVDKIRSFDIDESVVKVAETFNFPWYQQEWKFKALTQDIMDIDYNEHKWTFWSNKNNRMSYPITDVPDTIINTSCEHIENFDVWYNKIPKGKLICLQSNDYVAIDEHVNCSNSLERFSDTAPMSVILYDGELELDNYTRFMKIGIK